RFYLGYGSAFYCWLEDGTSLLHYHSVSCSCKQIVGCEVTSVSAITSHIDRTLPPPDVISSNFKLENGCSGVFVMVVSSSSPKIIWRVVGSKGTVQVERGKVDGKHGYLVSLYSADGQCESTFHPFCGVHEELKIFIHDIVQANLKVG
ncbi:hypothetical protein Gotur_020521, partial [Gossypium turneri]